MAHIGTCHSALPVCGNRVREQLSFYSANQTELSDLFAVLIGGKGATPERCQKLAGIGLEELAEMSLEELGEYVPKTAAERIYAAFELGWRTIKVRSRGQRTILRSPQDAADFVRSEIAHEKQEHFVVLLLGTKNHIIGKETVFVGSLNASIVHPRETFKTAIRRSAAAIICLHNHPSGDPQPSAEDRNVTRRLKEAGEVVGIELLDHIIIGEERFYSFREHDLL